MPYPKTQKAEDPNAEYRTSVPEVTTPTVPAVGVSGPQGGAPRLNRERAWSGRSTPPSYQAITPNRVPLTRIREQYPEFVNALQAEMQKQYDALDENQRQSPFWQGFQQYKEWLPAMVVRRAQANRMMADNEVGRWMSWLESMGR